MIGTAVTKANYTLVAGGPVRQGAPVQSRAAAPALSLDKVAIGSRYTVDRVMAPMHIAEWTSRLEDLGFIPGEQVMVTARAPFGSDPLVVRVGHSTFALRRAEAACVLLNTAS